MKTYIVTYDLRKEISAVDYERLITLIKEDGVWARLGGSSYLIQSHSSAVELRDKFKRALDKNDMLYVGEYEIEYLCTAKHKNTIMVFHLCIQQTYRG